MERESRTLEYKEKISSSFLKTVSAYANYNGGKIIFGVDDDGVVVGVEKPIDGCLRIENMINDSIDPVPTFTLDPDMERKIIILTVEEGSEQPYLLKGKAYRRADSSTVEVDRTELKRLVLLGSNMSFDEMSAQDGELSFEVLEKHMKVLGIESLGRSELLTLDLMRKDSGYTNAGAILADANDFPGISAARLGESISEFLDRRDFVGVSAVSQLEDALEMYRDHYVIERVEGMTRNKVNLVPEEAFREAVANALVHRAWDINANILIRMFADRIEVISPGGLPRGLTETEYLNENVSILRNPILANVFFRLGYIEKFGTGVQRIRQAYERTMFGPEFKISDNAITVILPVVKDLLLTDDEQHVLALLGRSLVLSKTEVAQQCGFTASKTLRILNALVEKGLVQRTGNSRSIKYRSA